MMCSCCGLWTELPRWLLQDSSRAQATLSQTRPDIAGYVKHYGPLTQVTVLALRVGSVACLLAAGPAQLLQPCAQVTVRGAGHMVPHDQPLRARAMIETWVGGVVFNVSHWQT